MSSNITAVALIIDRGEAPWLMLGLLCLLIALACLAEQALDHWRGWRKRREQARRWNWLEHNEQRQDDLSWRQRRSK